VYTSRRDSGNQRAQYTARFVVTARTHSAPSAQDEARQRWRDAALAGLIGLLTFALYWPTRAFEFLNYDDPYYVSENARVVAGLTWSGVRWAFTTFEDGNWFPLTWLSHMADVSLWGVNAGPHHMTNAALHALTAALLLALGRSIGFTVAPAAFAAALFAWHPQRVESVAWIAERKDVLSAMFSVLTLLLYRRYARAPGAGRYAVVVAAYCAALMSKAMPVTLPFVMLLMDYWPLCRSSGGRWPALVREKIPLLALAAAAAVVAFLAQSSAGATADLGTVPLTRRIANAAVSYWLYLGDFAWPAGLAVFYPRPIVSGWQLGVAVAGLAIVSGMVWRLRARYSAALVAWLWYLGMLIPVIGLVQIGAQGRADRYTYLPMIGLCLAAAAGLQMLTLRSGWHRRIALAFMIAVPVAVAVMTSRYLPVWRSSVTLFEHAKLHTPPNYTTLNNLGEALAARGDMTRAAQTFREAADVAPRNPAARVNLATALARIGRIDDAAREFSEAIRLQPTNAAAVAGFGAVLARQGKLAEAAAILGEAVRMAPENADTTFNLASVLIKSGRLPEASAVLAAAVSRNPGDVALRANLGAVLAELGKYDEAIVQFNEALRLDPSLDQVRANLHRAMEMKKR
jgi:Flp pilus assembly protein TadD